MENGANVWAADTHMGDLGEAADSWLQPGSSEPIWQVNPRTEVLSVYVTIFQKIGGHKYQVTLISFSMSPLKCLKGNFTDNGTVMLLKYTESCQKYLFFSIKNI